MCLKGNACSEQRVCAFYMYKGESSENLKSAKAEHINRENSCVTVNKVAVMLDTSHSSAHHTIHNMLQFHKVWGLDKWLLNWRYVDASQELFCWHNAKGDGFLNCIVTGEKSRVQYFQSQMKRPNKKLHHCCSPEHKKFCTQASVGKVILMLCDHKDPFVEHYTPTGTTATSPSYCDILRNHLRPAVSSECHGLLGTGVLLQHDNARQQTTCLTSLVVSHSRKLLFERLPNSMKMCMRHCTSGYICSQRNFFSWGIQALVKC